MATATALPAVVGLPGRAAAQTITFKSLEQALEQGLGAIKTGNFEIAIPALEAATQSNGRIGFLAKYYLARIFADNGHAWTDHAKAYILYQHLADEHADIDPDEDFRAPYVAKALMALAQYVRHGVADIGLRPNVSRAAKYIHHAATVFSDEDAQFEHAKLLLIGDGVDADTRRAIHWFSVLSQRGHAGAQAFLADLYARGRHVPKDHKRALALITLAVESAPAHERIWIEDIYQHIYCGASEGVRTEANGMVADWRQKYSRSVDEQARAPGVNLELLAPNAIRTCSDGRAALPSLRGIGFNAPASSVGPDATAPLGLTPQGMTTGATTGQAPPANGLLEIMTRPRAQ
jgi:uncharacterized protein